MYCSKFGYASSANYEKGLDRCEESLGATLCCGVDRGREIVGCRDALDLQAEPHQRGGSFQLLHLQRPDRVCEMSQYSHKRKRRNHFLQQLKALAAEIGRHDRLPCDVASRPCEARHNSGSDWVADWARDNWDCAGCLLGGKDAG